ncbi:MAG: hypothetical protein NZ937_09545, partial [Armatimonadetes bacterium]|nr:hypothetical protein [Armatimonadota bacterium]
GRAPQISQGLRIVAVPVQSEDDDPKVVFNFPENKWATWDPMANNGQGGYVLYPNNATKFSEPEKVPGRAYWVRLNEPTIPRVFGYVPDDTQPFTIQLKRGWNLIGNPWLVDLIWDLEAIQVQVGNETRPLMNARGIIEPYAWRWNGNAYQLVFDSNFIPNVDNKIHAWEGAWVYAWQDCNLILPAPEGNRSRKTRLAGKKPEGWFASLVAQVDGQEGKGFFGVSPTTRLQISQPPSPPESQNNQKVQVLFLDKNGNATVADFRTGLGQRQEWDVIVKWDTGQGARGKGQGREVTLTFDGVGYAPRDVSLWLVDMVTGKRLYMRTQSAYRFVASEGETSRRFKVIAEAGNTRPLQVVGLKAVPMRGRSLAIEFALTKAAQTQVEVLTLTGRRVAVLESGQSRSAGRHQVIWQGRNGDGQVLPTSAYIVRVVATDDEGRQVQATTVARLR